jgi:hypothetical protein
MVEAFAWMDLESGSRIVFSIRQVGFLLPLNTIKRSRYEKDFNCFIGVLDIEFMQRAF